MGHTNGKPMLTNEDRAELSKTSGYSEEDVEKKFNQFLTEHPQGKLNRKDFTKMISEALATMDVSKIERHVFRIYDTNKDGFIDFAEFMLVYHVLSEGTPEEVLKKIFRTFDYNGDGLISMKEMQRLVKDLRSLFSDPNIDHKDVATSAFKEMDKDQNGFVTLEEFVKAVMDQEIYSKMITVNILNIFIDQE